MKMPKILIVDDNLAGRELLIAVLKYSNYELIEACDGQEALDLISRTQPDLVLLDIELPVLDGIKVVRRLRKHSRFASLPVLAVTANAMQGTREKLLAEGFSGYVTKPVDGALIRKQIREILGY